MLKTGEAWTGTRPQSFEQKAAFVEALLASLRPGASRIVNGNGFAEGVPIRDLVRNLRRLAFGEGLSGVQVRRLADQVLFAALPNAVSLRFLASRGWRDSIRALLERRFEEQFAHQGVTEALQTLGLLRDPRRLERWSEFLRRNQTVVQASLTAVFALPGLALQPPGHFPGVNRLQSVEIPKELYDRALREGFDAVAPDLMRLYGSRANQTLAVAWMRRSYNAFLLAYFFKFLLDERKAEAEAGEEMAAQTEEEIRQIQEAILSPQSQGEMLFESWISTFRQQNGRDPDPNSVEYQAIRSAFIPPPSR
jgi:hypothetical protein